MAVIMSEIVNKNSNKNEEYGTTDSVNNDTKYPQSESTHNCLDVPNKATSFVAEVISHKHCLSMDEEHGMWRMCLVCGYVSVRSGHLFTNERLYEKLESASHKSNAAWQ